MNINSYCRRYLFIVIHIYIILIMINYVKADEIKSRSKTIFENNIVANREQLTEKINTLVPHSSLLDIKNIWYVSTLKSISDHASKSEGNYENGNLKKIIDQIGSLEGIVLLPGNKTYTILSNLTIPENITIVLQKGALIEGKSVKLIVRGKLEAGVHKIFSGNMNVIWNLKKNSKLYTAWWGDVGNDYNDDSIPIQKAIDSYYSSTSSFKNTDAAEIYIHSGIHRIYSSLKIWRKLYLHLTGASVLRYSSGTRLKGFTGDGEPVIFIGGTSASIFKNIAIECVTSGIGIFMARLSGPHNNCNRIKFENISIDANSDISANNDLGRIGILNISAEQTTYENMYIKANLPIILSNKKSLAWIDGKENSFDPTKISRIKGAKHTISTISTLVHTFIGDNTLIALDSYRPALSLFNAGTIDLGNTYMTQRLTGKPKGKYSTAIDCRSSSVFQHHGLLEGFAKIIHISGLLKAAYCNWNSGMIPKGFDVSTVGVIDLAPHSIIDGGNILNCDFIITSISKRSLFEKRQVNLKNFQPGKIINCSFRTDSNIAGNTHPLHYSKKKYQNCTFSSLVDFVDIKRKIR